MNKVVLKRTGNLEINGVEVEAVIAVGFKSNGTDRPTLTIMFDVDEFDIAVGMNDFLTAIHFEGETRQAAQEYIKGLLDRQPSGSMSSAE